MVLVRYKNKTKFLYPKYFKTLNQVLTVLDFFFFLSKVVSFFIPSIKFSKTVSTGFNTELYIVKNIAGQCVFYRLWWQLESIRKKYIPIILKIMVIITRIVMMVIFISKIHYPYCFSKKKKNVLCRKKKESKRMEVPQYQLS